MVAGRTKRRSLRIVALVAAAGPAVALVTACSATGGAVGAGAAARAHPVTGTAHAAAPAADVRAAAVSRAAATPSAAAPHSSSGPVPDWRRDSQPGWPACGFRLPGRRLPSPRARPRGRGGRGSPGDVREPGQPDHLGGRRAEPGAPAGPDRLETPARAQPDDHRPQALERPLLGPDRLRVPAGRGHCQSGDCGGRYQCTGNGAIPATLAEYDMNAWDGLDFYDVSMVDGSNLPMFINVTHGTAANRVSRKGCVAAGCTTPVNCPSVLRVKAAGAVVGCESACARFGTDQYCCRGAWAARSACNPAQWPVDYAAVFKKAEPYAYSYADDDATSTFVCKGRCDYRITFGLTPTG